MADFDFYTNDPDEQNTALKELEKDRVADEKARQIEILTKKREDLDKNLQGLNNQVREKGSLRNAQSLLIRRLGDENVALQKSLNIAKDKRDKVKKILQSIREDIFDFQESRSKIPQALSLLKNFAPQELESGGSIKVLQEIASGTTAKVSYRNQEGIMETILQDQVENPLTVIDKAVIEFFEIGERPVMSVGVDYKKLLEPGLLSLDFWEALSDISSNEIERRNDAILKLSRKLDSYEQSILGLERTISLNNDRIQAALTTDRSIASEIKEINDQIRDLDNQKTTVQSSLKGLGVESEAGPPPNTSRGTNPGDKDI